MIRQTLLIVAMGTFISTSAQVQQTPGLRRDVPKMNKTWRVGVHNAYWHGSDLSADPFASGPKQHILDSLMIDRARGIEIDLHSNHNERRFSVYHTKAEQYSFCRSLEGCLDVIRAWHFGNPQHDVLFLHLEAKEILPIPRFFAPDALTPWDLDRVVDSKLRHGPKSMMFTPKEYIKWCGDKVWPEFKRNDITWDQYVGEDLTTVTGLCGWPTMDELRGKIMVTLHGSGANNELDVRDYNFAYNRKLRDTLMFTMAGVAGAQGTSDCFDFGFPSDARWGNVCDFNIKTAILDLQTLAFSDFLPGPFYPDPSASAEKYQRLGYLYRSRDRSSRQEYNEARQSLLGAGYNGFQLISGDLPRFNPINDTSLYPQESFASGCLLDRKTGQPVLECDQTKLIEPSSAIELQARAPSLEYGLGGASDRVFGAFRVIPANSAGQLRAHISTRTDHDPGTGGSYMGRYGCLMARERLDSASPFIAICRLRHRLSWGTDKDGTFVLYRRTSGGETVQQYYDTGSYPSDPRGDSSGVPELDAFVFLGHSTDRKLWQAAKRVTDDPDVRYDVVMRQNNGSDWIFDSPLEYIGIATDGGALTEDGLIGHFLFSNVRYNNGYVKLSDLPLRMEGIGKNDPSTLARDRSSLAGLCHADLASVPGFPVTLLSPSGFSKTGFGPNAYYVQRVTVTNNNPRPLIGPLALKLEGLDESVTPLAAPQSFAAQCQSPASPAVLLPLVNNELPPGQSVTLNLAFRSPADKPIRYTPKVIGYGLQF